MDTKSKLFFIILLVSVLVSSILVYNRTMIEKNYEVVRPEVESENL